MASVTNALRSGVFGEDYVELADQVAVALGGLPRDGRRAAMRRLTEMLAEQEGGRDRSQVDHFVQSLLMTARMSRVRDYRIAMAKAEKPAEPRDIDDVIAMLEVGTDESGTYAA
ncbi:hypothetical protein [Actinokineospora xionganensis]|uniref:Uncharacterized protein n=1 Tax=Actinokineospora xionganensis TaxID=2684470 RepID=A0ABR7LB30_9PSEU|nr:hypothetical protein [Actinokineospora xionganensis]MBC6449859.1 hypothetical protein [Actinokineospora xionganensis]